MCTMDNVLVVTLKRDLMYPVTSKMRMLLSVLTLYNDTALVSTAFVSDLYFVVLINAFHSLFQLLVSDCSSW